MEDALKGYITFIETSESREHSSSHCQDVTSYHIHKSKVKAVFCTFFYCVREAVNETSCYNLQSCISNSFSSLGITEKKQKKKLNSNKFHKYLKEGQNIVQLKT